MVLPPFTHVTLHTIQEQKKRFKIIKKRTNQMIDSLLHQDDFIVGWGLSTTCSTLVDFSISALQSGHLGVSSLLKLSLIHPLQSAEEQAQISVSSVFISSST
jgi:hypothetical protein